jgi:peptidoglycan-associated lipoprotein
MWPNRLHAAAIGDGAAARARAGRTAPASAAAAGVGAARHAISRAGSLLMALALAGCAAPPPAPPNAYVALLPETNGSTGLVVYVGPQGTAVLEHPFQAAALQGQTGTFTVTEQQLQRDAGAAIAAQPRAPRVFVVYFEAGDTQITPASQALLPLVLQEVRSRPGADLSVIGHTDTQGNAAQNALLSVRRAEQVAELLKEAIDLAASTEISSHGERNLLVHTPDETNEPRNRRVEITVR